MTGFHESTPLSILCSPSGHLDYSISPVSLENRWSFLLQNWICLVLQNHFRVQRTFLIKKNLSSFIVFWCFVALYKFILEIFLSSLTPMWCVCVCVCKFVCACADARVSVSLCENVHLSIGAHGSQKRVLDFLELEFQVIVNLLAQVLGTVLKSSARTASILTTEPSVQSLNLLFKGKQLSQSWNWLKVDV